MRNNFMRLMQPGRLAIGMAAMSQAALLTFTPLAAHADNYDVPYVPTRTEVVEQMLDMADIGPDDYLIDLGSGDGRIPIAAVKERGARGALGVEIDPGRFKMAQGNARDAGVADRVQFVNQDLFETDFSRATVVTMFLLPTVNLRLRPQVLEMPPGTRIVSHQFDMGDWESDERARVDTRNVYLWVVPAKVSGERTLNTPDGDLALKLEQNYQNVAGTAKLPDGSTAPVQGKLRGTDIQLTVGEGNDARLYVGKVESDAIIAPTAAANPVPAVQSARR